MRGASIARATGCTWHHLSNNDACRGSSSVIRACRRGTEVSLNICRVHITIPSRIQRCRSMVSLGHIVRTICITPLQLHPRFGGQASWTKSWAISAAVKEDMKFPPVVTYMRPRFPLLFELAARELSITRSTGCVLPREGCSSVAPVGNRVEKVPAFWRTVGQFWVWREHPRPAMKMANEAEREIRAAACVCF